MNTPLPYLQLIQQFGQHIEPRDKRHLTVFCEIVSAILLSGSGCLSHWLPFLIHRESQARSHMSRLSYFLKNQRITAQIFYQPLLQFFLQSWNGQSLLLALDTSVLWDQFCLIEVSFVWGGRSITVAQKVIEHNSATVAVSDYLPVLEMARQVLPPNSKITLLADRGFEHSELIHWLIKQNWSWYLRAKCDLMVTLTTGKSQPLSQLCPKTNQVHLFNNITIFNGIQCHLGIANKKRCQRKLGSTNRSTTINTNICYVWKKIWSHRTSL